MLYFNFFHNNFIADFTFILYDHCIFQARISNLSSNQMIISSFFLEEKEKIFAITIAIIYEISIKYPSIFIYPYYIL